MATCGAMREVKRVRGRSQSVCPWLAYAQPYDRAGRIHIAGRKLMTPRGAESVPTRGEIPTACRLHGEQAVRASKGGGSGSGSGSNHSRAARARAWWPRCAREVCGTRNNPQPPERAASNQSAQGTALPHCNYGALGWPSTAHCPVGGVRGVHACVGCASSGGGTARTDHAMMGVVRLAHGPPRCARRPWQPASVPMAASGGHGKRIRR